MRKETYMNKETLYRTFEQKNEELREAARLLRERKAAGYQEALLDEMEKEIGGKL